MRLIPAHSLPLSRWENGAGRKADVASGEGWMVGYAWLDTDAPFSDFAGRDRTITLVEGPGFNLHVAGENLTVDRPFTPTRFDGGAPTACRIAGPCRVLNAMTDRARLRHAVTILDRSGPIGPGDSLACLVVALDGGVRLDDTPLPPLDAAWLAGPVALHLQPGGHAACIRVDHAR